MVKKDTKSQKGNDRSPKTDAKKNEYLPAEMAQALEPYGLNQPYDLKLRIQQGKWLVKQEVGIRFALGCLLLEIHASEDFRTYGKIVSEEFGMHFQRAYTYMAFAKKCIDLPKLKAFGEDNWSKVIALMDSCTEEELKEIEEKGFDGKVLDEYDGMSVREFKALLKEQKEQLHDANKKAEKKYKSQVDLLSKEIKDWHKIIPPALQNASKGEKQLYYAQAKYDDFESALSALIFAEMEIEDIKIGAKVEGLIKTMYARIVHFAEKWEAHKKGDIQG